MWVELTDAEVATILAAVQDHSVVNKLCARPDQGTGAFVKAAERDDLPNVYVDDFGVVQRGEFGAYVMCWRWITEKEAGLPTAYEPLGISAEVAHRLKAFEDFQLGSINRVDERLEADGRYQKFTWHFQHLSSHWRIVFQDPEQNRHDWMYSGQWSDDDTLHPDLMMSLIIRGIEKFTERGPDPAVKEQLPWRMHLESYIYGGLKRANLERRFIVSPIDVDEHAEAHRAAMQKNEQGQLTSSGFGIARPDIDAHHHAKTTRQETPEHKSAADGDMIFTADLKLCATMYVRAKNLREAQKVVDSYSNTCLDVSQGMISESAFTDWFPDVEIAENMTIYGQFEGDILQPRYDLANAIDYG
jgi:hypothetical protein